jgi:polyphosphate glucokinase
LGTTLQRHSVAPSRSSMTQLCRRSEATSAAKCFFLGLGTGLGSTLVVDSIIEPMELSQLPYKKGTYEDYVGVRGLSKHGQKKWQRYVADVVARLTGALEPDDVVLGGGNAKKLTKLPPGCRVGDNAYAFLGGFRLWEKERKDGSTHRTTRH